MRLNIPARRAKKYRRRNCRDWLPPTVIGGDRKPRGCGTMAYWGGTMSNKGTILIRFAWAMEIVGVAGGVINSTYTTFGDNLPSIMIALAVAELGRVPLASVLFHKHKLMQGIAILGLMSLGYLAVENWTFGFERIVDLRLKTVNSANRELSRAEADLAALLNRREQVVKMNGAKREELRRGVDQRDASTSELTNQLSKEAEVHQGTSKEFAKRAASSEPLQRHAPAD